MEDVLPRDMMNMILGMLPNYDLFQYGLTSKRSLESAEIEWRQRHKSIVPRIREFINITMIPSDIIDNIEFKSEDGMTSYKTYTETLSVVISKGLSVMFSKIDNIHKPDEKKNSLDDFLKVVYDNRIILQHQDFVNFRNILHAKLHEFIFGNTCEKQIAHKYYPLFFPKEYNSLLQAIVLGNDE